MSQVITEPNELEQLGVVVAWKVVKVIASIAILEGASAVFAEAK